MQIAELSVAFALVGIGVLATGCATPSMSVPTSRVSRLEIIDNNGDVRAVFGIDENEDVTLSVLGLVEESSDVKSPFSVRVTRLGEVDLTIASPNGREFTRVRSGAGGGQTLEVRDDETGIGLTFQLMDRLGAMLEILGVNGRPVIRFKALAGMFNPILSFRNRNGAGGLAFSVTEDGLPVVLLGAGNDRSAFVIRVSDDGRSITSEPVPLKAIDGN